MPEIKLSADARGVLAGALLASGKAVGLLFWQDPISSIMSIKKHIATIFFIS